MTRKTKMRRRTAANPLSSPVGRAMLARTIRQDMHAILNTAQMHAWAGSNPPQLLDNAGRMVYVVLGAAGAGGMTTARPEIRILLGMAEALGDLRIDGDIERHRPAIQSGLLAIERLLPDLQPLALAESAMELDHKLAGPFGMGTADLHRMFPTAIPQP